MNDEVDELEGMRSEKIIDLTEAEEISEEDTDGASNLFEDWDTDYADRSASTVYSWGRD